MRQGEGGRKGGKEGKKERKREGEGGREEERQTGGREGQPGERRLGKRREGQGMILGCEVFPPHSYEEMPQREHALAHGAL